MTKGKLSDRQKRMLEFIQRFTADSGYPPSIREIGDAADISSTSVVNYNLNILEREGYPMYRGKTNLGLGRVTRDSAEASVEGRA